MNTSFDVTAASASILGTPVTAPATVRTHRMNGVVQVSAAAANFH